MTLQIDKLTSRQRGDYQTPEGLASKVWATLESSQFDLIIEPTFGRGSFLLTLPKDSRGTIVGWEIDSDYFHSTKEALTRHCKYSEMNLALGDVFRTRPSDVKVHSSSKVLVIGNPPWVTNSEQSSLGGQNTGTKRNLKSLKGLAAKTGKANFDISEAIILHLIDLLGTAEFVQFAFLGKFTVLRNLMQFFSWNPNIGDFEFHRIDSQKHFGAAVDAGLIKFKIHKGVQHHAMYPVYSSLGGRLERTVGLIEGRFVYDIPSYTKSAFLERSARPAYLWRQGVKHDLGNVLELEDYNGVLTNRLGERVEIEPQTLYYLYKSSDIFHGRSPRFVIPIYQRDLKDSLEDLPVRYPLLHAYLMKHQEAFRNRKSSIYRNKNPFSVFGVGEYTHSRFKIAVGGFYSEPVFRLLQAGSYPVVVDDTSYSISTNDHEEAKYICALLNLESTRDFLKAISYRGDKRTFSKEILSRVCIPPFGDVPKEMRRNINDPSRLKDWLIQY